MLISFNRSNWKSSLNHLEISKGSRPNELNFCYYLGSVSVCFSLMAAFAVNRGISLKLQKLKKKGGEGVRGFF